MPTRSTPRTLVPPRLSALVTAAGVAALLCGCSVGGFLSNARGVDHYRAGNYTAARADFQQAVLENPYNADYMHNLALAMQKQGDVAAAEETLKRSINMNPSHQPSYHALASLMKDEGRHADAAALLQAYSGTQPFSPGAQIEMAWLQRESGDYAGAEQSLRQALRAQPNNATAMAHLGQLYQDTGRAAEARMAYQRSLAADWNQPQVHSRLAAIQTVPAYRMNERLAAARPVYGYGDSQMAYTPMTGAPMVVQGPWPTYAAAPGTYYYPTSPAATATALGPTPTFQPTPAGPARLTSRIQNADPAHVPEATAERPDSHAH